MTSVAPQHLTDALFTIERERRSEPWVGVRVLSGIEERGQLFRRGPRLHHCLRSLLPLVLQTPAPPFDGERDVMRNV